MRISYYMMTWLDLIDILLGLKIAMIMRMMELSIKSVHHLIVVDSDGLRRISHCRTVIRQVASGDGPKLASIRLEIYSWQSNLTLAR